MLIYIQSEAADTCLFILRVGRKGTRPDVVVEWCMGYVMGLSDFGVFRPEFCSDLRAIVGSRGYKKNACQTTWLYASFSTIFSITVLQILGCCCKFLIRKKILSYFTRPQDQLLDQRTTLKVEEK